METLQEKKEFLSELSSKLNKVNARKWNIEKRIKEFAIELERYYKYTNLKLHDASYYRCSDIFKDFPQVKENEAHQLFDDFCSDNWCYFEDFLEIELSGVEFEHIGRTSSFRATMNQLKELDTSINGDNDYYGQLMDLTELDDKYQTDLLEYVAQQKENTFYGYDNTYEIIESYVDELYSIVDNAEDIIDGMLSDFKKIKRFYTYVNDFKSRQVEYFKEYIENYLEDVFESDPERRESVKIIHSSNEEVEITTSIDKELIRLYNNDTNNNIVVSDEKEFNISYENMKKLLEWLRECNEDYYCQVKLTITRN